jgi:tetratricopeptide (TPR) repeat protein
MQALVAVDPKYVWGWHQLADWYNETGRSQSYLEAASELVRLQPGHPVALTLRGEAKLQTGDRDGGKADLRDALAAAAAYSPAAAILFDAHLADDELREARQVLAILQEHLAGPEVAVKQIQLAAKTADPDAAVRAFAEVCEGPGQSPFPIQAGLTEMRAGGWEDRALRVLRESWQSGGPFHPWAPIFWIDSPDGQIADPGDRLRAADAVIKAYPRFVPGHDSKAEQLAAAGRFDEALAVCENTDLGDPPPRELRARAAWVEAKRGDRTKAIAQMRGLVAEDPTFVLGWRQLAGWYDAAGRHRECLEASGEYVKLEPQNPVAHVYRGEAKRNLGDRRGAAADFTRAFEIDPGFEVAGLNLITEQLATGDVAGAARTLATLREHADGPLVKLRAVQVACRQGDADAAVGQFHALAADPEAGRGVLREAVLAFDTESWGARLTSELKDLAFADDANPALAGLWAERAAAAGSLDAVADRVSELLARNPDAGRELVLAYAWALAEAGKSVQGVVQKYTEVLRADDSAWARAGGALAAAGHSAQAAMWLADYRDRDGLEPWMLRPLAASYRAHDQDDKALEVCRAAVKLGGPEEVLAEFRAWLAVDLALSGQPEEAAGQIARVDTATLGDGPRLVLSLAEAVVMVLRAGPGGKAAAFAEAKDHLRAAAGSCATRDVPAGAGRVYRRVVARLAADAGTVAAKLWAVWQRVAPAVR